MFTGISVLSLLCGVSYAQVIRVGKCPQVEVQKDFDVKEYLGDWYELYKFRASFEDKQECIKANYLLKENGHIKVSNQGKTKDGELITAVGDGYSPDTNEPAKLLVRFSDTSPYGNYWVLDTDYKTYTLIYSCTNIVETHIEFAWILTREKSISEEIKNKLFQELESYNIKTKDFLTTDQNAPYC